ncbi:PXDN [Lepeophtheirus salmonis]|uniref:PXDN n=1 Tax=Lepeophtheirus salmonis TaxID=72036 RepID=A0A7R8CIX8_LEPSM|nr:PXDN [Lepeophtheirus salmonis]CAF2782115.1 PXDN [Lepeophtheirus salmonis]
MVFLLIHIQFDFSSCGAQGYPQKQPPNQQHESLSSSDGAPSSSSSGCALIIPGPGRSSAFDHGSRVFGGSSFDYQGSNTCITYEAVNAAFTTALERVGLPPVRGKFTTDDVGNLGTVIHETSRYLAKQYGLSKDAISNGLPLIDTTKTIIEGYCPPFFDDSKVHSGALQKFLAPNFADGISAPRASKTGNPLPSARIPGDSFIDHDITLSAETKDPRTGKTPKCCEEGQTAVHPNCLPIEIPSHDTFFSKHKQRCMNFVRSQAGLRYNCRLGPRDTFNEVSSLLDAGTVYSNSDETLESLRLYKDGLLKMLPVFNEFEMKELLPLKLESPDEGCIRPSEDVYCFSWLEMLV